MEDARKVFDTIPEQFDKWRPCYSQELFDFIIEKCGLNKDKKCLEIGPGTGQATDFALKTGCDYLAIELGEHLSEFMKEKYKGYDNFRIINADFETYPFVNENFDLVYSAATIQWIPEGIAFPKCYELLKENGYLAMFMTKENYRTNNPVLYDDICKVYDQYFESETPYTQRFRYENATKYRFRSIEKFEFCGERELSAEEHIAYIGTHADHITLKPECREQFISGIRNAINKHGGKIQFIDTYVLYLCKK